MIRFQKLSVYSIILLFIFSCSDNSISGGEEKPDRFNLSGSITTSGGSISNSDNTIIFTFPPGSVDDQLDVKIEKGGDFDEIDGFEGDVIKLIPSGQEFNKPIKVNIDPNIFSDYGGEEPEILHWSTEAGIVEVIEYEKIGDSFEFEIDHFSELTFNWKKESKGVGIREPGEAWTYINFKWDVDKLTYYVDTNSSQANYLKDSQLVRDAIKIWDRRISEFDIVRTFDKNSAQIILSEDDLSWRTCVSERVKGVFSGVKNILSVNRTLGRTCSDISRIFVENILDSNDKQYIVIDSSIKSKDEAFIVIAHEIGHALGLHHTIGIPNEYPVNSSADYPIMQTGTLSTADDLHDLDLKALDHHYTLIDYVEPKVTTLDVSSITHSTATLNYSVTEGENVAGEQHGICFSETNTPDINRDDCSIEFFNVTGEVSRNVTGLDSQKSYYSYAYVKHEFGLDYGEVIPFETAEFNCGDSIFDIQGNEYQTVKIGSDCWMAENLKTTVYRNGRSLRNDKTYWTGDIEGLYAYYHNYDVNGDEYGNLYNLFAATDERGLCPKGWSVTSEKNWRDVKKSLDPNAVKKMKSTDLWENGGNGNNSSGLNILPGGAKFNEAGRFFGMGTVARFWTITESDKTNNYWGQMFKYVSIYDDNRLLIGDSVYWGGYSVRCVREK